MFLKSKNIIFKIRRSKVTDYAALKVDPQSLCSMGYSSHFGGVFNENI